MPPRSGRGDSTSGVELVAGGVGARRSGAPVDAARAGTAGIVPAASGSSFRSVASAPMAPISRALGLVQTTLLVVRLADRPVAHLGRQGLVMVDLEPARGDPLNQKPLQGCRIRPGQLGLRAAR